MALLAKVGSFAQATSTGNQQVTGLGFAPEWIVFFGNSLTADGSQVDSEFFFGAATSSTSRYVSGYLTDDGVTTTTVGCHQTDALCIRTISGAGTVLSAADFVSMDANGFTVNWSTADATARVVNYLALGGTDLTNSNNGSQVTSGSTGNVGYTPYSFQPKVLLLSNALHNTSFPLTS